VSGSRWLPEHGAVDALAAEADAALEVGAVVEVVGRRGGRLLDGAGERGVGGDLGVGGVYLFYHVVH
jgi:hypothetical protein